MNIREPRELEYNKKSISIATYIYLYIDFLKLNIAKAIINAKNIPKELLLINIPDSLSNPKSSE